MIPTLDDTVMLRRIGRRVVAPNAFRCTVVAELDGGELTAVIHVQDLQFVPAFQLCLPQSRLVAKGYVQCAGIDFGKVFAQWHGLGLYNS